MIDDGLIDELDVATDVLVPARRKRDIDVAPKGFDPAAVFLLRLGWPNLFEPANARPGPTTEYRCKGCGEIVKRTGREAHHKRHVRASRDRSLLDKQAKPLYRATTPSGSEPVDNTHTHEGDTDMAKATASKSKSTETKEPRVLKTKIARESAVAILKRANKPLTMDEITVKVMADKKVVDAGVPKGTVSAQVNFALAEDPPRIYRVGRGVYAAVGVEAPVEAPADGKASVDVKPDPKPAPRKRAAKKTETKTETTAPAEPVVEEGASD